MQRVTPNIPNAISWEKLASYGWMQWNPAQTLAKIPAPSSDKNKISQKRDGIGDQLNDKVVSIVVDKPVESVGQRWKEVS